MTLPHLQFTNGPNLSMESLIWRNQRKHSWFLPSGYKKFLIQTEKIVSVAACDHDYFCNFVCTLAVRFWHPFYWRALCFAYQLLLSSLSPLCHSPDSFINEFNNTVVCGHCAFVKGFSLLWKSVRDTAEERGRGAEAIALPFQAFRPEGKGPEDGLCAGLQAAVQPKLSIR